MRQEFCPRCHGTDIEAFNGGVSGTVRCKKCGYMGTLIISKEFVKSIK